MAWHDTFFASEAWKAVQRVRYAPERAAAIASGICGRLGLRPGTSLLDVPCGNGPLSVAIARHGVHVTGVDSDRGWIEEAGRAASASVTAPRPAWSVLGHGRWSAAGLPPMRDWLAALEAAMPELLAAAERTA